MESKTLDHYFDLMVKQILEDEARRVKIEAMGIRMGFDIEAKDNKTKEAELDALLAKAAGDWNGQ